MTYFRRFRMEFNFADREIPSPLLPDGYFLVPWSNLDVNRHASVKYLSFRDELDSRVFPCLSTLDGCRNLMAEIAGLRNFVPAATWLLCRRGIASGLPVTDCGTMQGLASRRHIGSVQNVGITPEHRGLGLGRALVLQGLRGFRDSGMKSVFLEATAENSPAIELYRSIGFRLIKTTYRQMPDNAS